MFELEGVFSVSGTCLIDAPRDKVWEVLMDFPRYGEWNAFVRSQTFVDGSQKAFADQQPAVGRYTLINVNLPPTMEQAGIFGRNKVTAIVTHFEPENYRVVWNATGMPYFLLHTERWQRLTVDEVSGKTKYETVEVFGGLIAYIVKAVVGAKLKLGFQAAADNLKQRVESLT